MKKDLTNFLIPFVYFIAGATTLAGVATTFYYKQDLRLSIAQVQILGSIAIIPWSIKPIYGIISDTFPIWKLKRKPYLFLSGLLGCAGYSALSTVVHSFTGAVIATMTSAAGFALADVIVDGVVAERSRTQKEAGRLQSICRASLLAGAIIVSYASGILVERIGARNVFFVTGSLPLLTSLLSLGVVELESASTLRTSLKDFWQTAKAVLRPDVLWSAIFLFIWRATPTSGGAFSYYLIDELHFTPEFFGRLALISHIMGIVGVFVFRRFLLSISLRKLFAWIIIASVVLSLPSLGLLYKWYELIHVSPKFFAMADTFVSAPLGEIGFLPLLVLVARICPKGIEATMFALLASLMNIGLAISDLGGAALVKYFDVHEATAVATAVAGVMTQIPANYENLHIVMWIAILSSFLPMPLLRFLPETRVAEEITPGVSPSAQAPDVSTLEERRPIA